MGNKGTIWQILFKALSDFANIQRTYNLIKENPEAKEKSTVLGRKSVGYSALFLLFLGLAGLSIYGAISLLTGLGILLSIILFSVAVVLVVNAITFLPLSLSCLIKQLKINKKAWGWIALAIHIIVLSITVVVVITLLGKI